MEAAVRIPKVVRLTFSRVESCVLRQVCLTVKGRFDTIRDIAGTEYVGGGTH